MEKEIMNWSKFEKGCKTLVKQINDSQYVFKNIYGIPRGGLPLAVKLSHLLDIPLITREILISKDTLIVDDVSDTGKTLNKYKNHKIATSYYKPRSIVKPKYYAFTTTKWIIFPWEKK